MHIIARLLNFLVVAAVCSACIWYYADCAGAADFYTQIKPSTERFLFPAAIVIAIINLYAVLRCIIRLLKKRQDIEISSADGSSIVSIVAVEKRLLELTSKFSDIRQARVALHIKKKDAPIHCVLCFGLAREHDVTGRVEEIKRCLHDAFQKLLPGAPGIEITARVVELRAEDVRKPSVEDSFAGPIYPIHENESAGDEDDR